MPKGSILPAFYETVPLFIRVHEAGNMRIFDRKINHTEINFLQLIELKSILTKMYCYDYEQ